MQPKFNIEMQCKYAAGTAQIHAQSTQINDLLTTEGFTPAV